MSIIVPYCGDNIRNTAGAFIKPNGEIIYLKKNDLMHLDYADNYCRGSEYKSLFERRHREKDYSIDPFSSSMLSPKELKVYKAVKFSDLGIDELDFMTDYLCWDLIRIGNVSTGMLIVTSSPQPCVRFFNYEIMEVPIERRRRFIGVTSDRSKLIWYENNELDEAENDDYRVRIRKIKEETALKDRPLFFK